MRNTKLYTWLTDLISAIFILLFVYTAITKLMDFTKFKSVLIASPTIGFASDFIAWSLPTLELLIALMLFMPIFRVWGLRASLVLMILLSGYLAYMIIFTSDRPCNCGGVLQQLTWLQHLLFNIAFTGLAAVGLWLSKRNEEFIAINRKSRTPEKNSRQNQIN